ncbi:hypothetical protein EU805_00860 [Salipiger sp. IMCC34102]|uniref:hypothetical protein n=1 Tax=Salipiger sp. IMCC34102 TaxID=2510647 RepID=UPI00101CB59E|nr:hypothetical protein [Salipiger sp. IMCC34102]RYH03954.1 hypothetical protein EU805_00860 [Salipiger sp. IMCC34102]
MSRIADRLMRYLKRRGLRDARKLIPSEPTREPRPEPPAPTPPGTLRLHLFGANFDSEAQALAFCTGTEDAPSELTRQLTGAYVDPSEVEVIHSPITPRLSEFLTEPEIDDVELRLAGDTTLILLTEHAFGGLPYTLDDTRDLTYLGEITVRV